MHKCQGFGQLLALPGPWVVKYRLVDTTLTPGSRARTKRAVRRHRHERPRARALRRRDKPPARAHERPAAIAAAVKMRETSACAAPAPSAPRRRWRLVSWPPGSCARASRRSVIATDACLRDRLPACADRSRSSSRRSSWRRGSGSKRLPTTASSPGASRVKVTLIAANRGRAAVEAKRRRSKGSRSRRPCKAAPIGGRRRSSQCETVTMPADAPGDRALLDRDGRSRALRVRRRTRPSACRSVRRRSARSSRSRFGGAACGRSAGQYRYEGNIFSGEKRMELLVVPALSVSVTPDIAIVPTAAPGPVRTAAKGRSERARAGHGDRHEQHAGRRPTPTSRSTCPRDGASTPAHGESVASGGRTKRQACGSRSTPPARLKPGTFPIRARVVSAAEDSTAATR